jgi:adenine-specific DNA-methyltransferase
VRILPQRGSATNGDQRLWLVKRIERVDDARVGHLELIGVSEPETAEVNADDLVVVAAFRDVIYPGLTSTGKVALGGDKPFHTVINAENYLALKALTYTHRGRVDAIYIDPPYNTGARDWKYNNDYVEGDDLYRHSKWLAFMERRLRLAGELLNPDDAVLIVTIDEKEVHRLGLLLEQVFPAARIQMVTIVTNPNGVARGAELARVEEHAYFCFFGAGAPARVSDTLLDQGSPSERPSVRWEWLLRGGPNSRRIDRPNLFYPIFINDESRRIAEVGEPIPLDHDTKSVPDRPGLRTLWPVRGDGEEARWRTSPAYLRELLESGYARLGEYNRTTDRWSILYLGRAQIRRIQEGEIDVVGRTEDGAVLLEQDRDNVRATPKTVWNRARHSAGEHGSRLLRSLTPGRTFPFPKSLYAVEDSLRVAIAHKPDAVVLDFFAGSGTTAHALMRLNHQDGGRRQSISVTNNEVSAEDQGTLREQRLRPGDPEWELHGICDDITKPRINAAITGLTPEGDRIQGDYRFTDEFPIADGFAENAEFFTLTFEWPISVSHNRAFARISPLLWMRAGSAGQRIDTVPNTGWAVAERYGILFDLDHTMAFCEAVEKADALRIAYVVTDDDRRFQSVAQRLPNAIEPVRLYESYLSNFRFANGD